MGVCGAHEGLGCQTPVVDGYLPWHVVQRLGAKRLPECDMPLFTGRLAALWSVQIISRDLYRHEFTPR